MKASQMSTETAAVFGFKSGLFAIIGAALVSLLAVMVGFTIVPLNPKQPMIDAGRRLVAGVFCSLTLGPMLAIKCLTWWPELLVPWVAAFKGVEEGLVLAYLTAAVPFIAVSGIVGFWLVAGVMLWFKNRENKDIGQLARDARADLTGGPQ